MQNNAGIDLRIRAHPRRRGARVLQIVYDATVLDQDERISAAVRVLLGRDEAQPHADAARDGRPQTAGGAL